MTGHLLGLGWMRVVCVWDDDGATQGTQLMGRMALLPTRWCEGTGNLGGAVGAWGCRGGGEGRILGCLIEKRVRRTQ